MVWSELIDFIRIKKHLTIPQQDQKIIKNLGTFKSLLFVDEADQILGKKLLKNHKLRNFYGSYTIQSIFGPRNRESSLLKGLMEKVSFFTTR